MRIAVDMDEVLCDTYAAKAALFRAEGFDWNDDDLRGRKLQDIAPRETSAAVECVMSRGLFFAGLAVIDGARDGLRALQDRHEVYIATAAMEYPASCGHKIAWMQRNFPFIDPMNIVLCGDKSILNADVLIDDSPRHFERFAGVGVCFSALHNMGQAVDHRAESWADVPALLDRIERDLAA